MPVETENWFTLRFRDNAVLMLDQRELPEKEVYLTLRSLEEVAIAIEDLAIRGAPAIGCAAAMGIALAGVTSEATGVEALIADLTGASERLARTRPTAVNLFWALGKMSEVWKTRAASGSIEDIKAALIEAAILIHDDDVRTCRAIGSAGLELIPQDSRILTHCNAGALATAGYGTALGLVRAAADAGRNVSVIAAETRPYLQGARLTAWELQRDRVPVTVITDSMSGHLMQRGEIDLVVVGADRIAANGDVANKIGTYTLAVLAKAHRIPFYVAAPVNTLDLATANGGAIQIEERDRSEVAELAGRMLVPNGVPVHHPAFDITPAELVTAIVTERGIVRPPFAAGLAALTS
jgi:methylthioribose-1-phosphate isomerase